MDRRTVNGCPVSLFEKKLDKYTYQAYFYYVFLSDKCISAGRIKRGCAQMEKYEALKIEVVEFEQDDVIATSTPVATEEPVYKGIE